MFKQKKLKNVLDDTLLSKLEEISPEFWTEFNQEYFSHFSSLLFSLGHFLREYYKMDEREFVPYIKGIEGDIYVAMKKDFNKKIKEISNFAVESFKKGFWYEDGIPRVWNKMSETEIDRLFNKFSKENSFVFDLFKEFKLLRNPLKCNYDCY